MTDQSAPQHICTFHKCGSNWFREIFWHIADMQRRDYLPTPKGTAETGVTVPVTRGGTPIHIFPGGNRKAIDETLGAGTADTAPFVLCLRDPRDALVSQYYSWKISHKNDSEKLLAVRAQLQEMPERDGLAFLIRERHFVFANQISKWLDRIDRQTGIVLMRYEGLQADFHGHLREALEMSNMPLDGLDFDRIEAATSFEARSGGRKPGEAKAHSHRRKGIVGDHANHFDTEIEAEYEAAYGALTRQLGYT